MFAVPFNRRQLAAGIVVASILAVQLPLWGYTGDLVAGLEPHCELDGEKFRAVFSGGARHDVTAGAERSGGVAGCSVYGLSAGTSVSYAEGLTTTPAAVAATGVWVEPDNFSASSIAAFLEVGAMLLAPLLLASAAALVVMRWQGGGSHDGRD